MAGETRPPHDRFTTRHPVPTMSTIRHRTVRRPATRAGSGPIRRRAYPVRDVQPLPRAVREPRTPDAAETSTGVSSPAARVLCEAVAGTHGLVYTVWEPSTAGAHDVTRVHDGQWLGRLGTRALPATACALTPGSAAHLVAAGTWRVAQDELAYRLILAAYPEAAVGRRHFGRILSTV